VSEEVADEVVPRRRPEARIVVMAVDAAFSPSVSQR
jgi:hypothetical protein